MNYRHQQKEIAYIRIAFYLCLCLTVFVGYKGYTAAKESGNVNASDMTCASVGSDQISNTNIGPANGTAIDPNMLNQLVQFAQSSQPNNHADDSASVQKQLTPDGLRQTGAANSQDQSNADRSPISSTDAASQSDSTPASSSVPNPAPSQTQLMTYLVKSLPANITMLKSLLRAETELTKGDTTDAGPVDQTLAHPMDKTTDPQPSDAAIDHVTSLLSQSHATDPSAFADGNSGSSSAIPDGGFGASDQSHQPNNNGTQNPLTQMGMGLANTPMAMAIICFALGMAAPHIFKRREPSIIYRPTVGVRPPSIFNSGWQGYGQRTAPDTAQPGGFYQYKPYFIGQELEVHPGQPKPDNSPYRQVRNVSQRFARKTNSMVRRFLEL